MASTSDRAELSIEAARPAEAQEWVDIVAECDRATYFHTPEWADLWLRRSNGTLRPRATLFSFSDGVLALLPSSEKTMLDLSVAGRTLPGLRTTISSNGNGYGGWISAGQLSAHHHELLWRRLSEKNIVIHQNPFDESLRDSGVPWTSEDFTQVVDLRQPAEQLRKSWARGHVSAINKADRAGLTATVATTRAEWKTFFDIYADSFERWGQPDDMFDASMFDILADHDPAGIRLWLVRLGDDVLAGAVFLYCNRTVMYWLGAFRKEFQHLRAAPFLHARVMLSAQTEERWWYDFNPSGGIEGVVTFKHRFGAQRLPANSVTRMGPFKRRLADVRSLVRPR